MITVIHDRGMVCSDHLYYQGEALRCVQLGSWGVYQDPYASKALNLSFCPPKIIILLEAILDFPISQPKLLTQRTL